MRKRVLYVIGGAVLLVVLLAGAAFVPWSGGRARTQLVSVHDARDTHAKYLLRQQHLGRARDAFKHTLGTKHDPLLDAAANEFVDEVSRIADEP